MRRGPVLARPHASRLTPPGCCPRPLLAVQRVRLMSADSRDDKLRRLLPTKDAPYDYQTLSKAETDALIEALGDGFGDRLASGYEALSLPVSTKSELLEHSFYARPAGYADPADEDYDRPDVNDAFWTNTENDEAPAPFEWFPLGFNQRRLRLYFQNQWDRFCLRQTREDPYIALIDRSEDKEYIFDHLAMQCLYQKPWYEAHALQFLNWIERDEYDLYKYPSLARITIPGFAGQLGRLVEQYYWRFRFEGVAISGTRARKGASDGGRVKAALHQPERSAWQKIAEEVWTHRPELSKRAVAETVRKRLRVKRTVKHIARYIIHP